MTILLRRTRIDDLPKLQEIEARAVELFRPTGLVPFPPGGILVTPLPAHQQAVEENYAFVAAEEATGQAVGFVMGMDYDGGAYLAELNVDPAFGRQGLGRALVLRFVQEARERGAVRVFLSTFKTVPWNAPFYASLGFEELPRADYRPWMKRFEQNQRRAGLDVAQRCFMQIDPGAIAPGA